MPPATPHRYRALVIILLIFATGVVANVAWAAIQRPHLRGLRGHSSAELSTLLVEEQPGLGTRYGFVGSLHDAATGGVLVVPDLSVVDEVLVRTIAHMDIEVASYDPSMRADDLESMNLGRHVAGQGEVSEPGDEANWMIATRSEDLAERMVYRTVDDTVVIVEESGGQG